MLLDKLPDIALFEEDGIDPGTLLGGGVPMLPGPELGMVIGTVSVSENTELLTVTGTVIV